MRTMITAAAAALLLAPCAAHAQDETLLTLIMPHDTDIALALSAAPEHLRADATVYVFTEFGYALAQQGSNGFTCLINRDSFFYGEVALKPTCWDAAGADSYVPVMLEVGAGLAGGKPHRAIVAEIEAGFAAGIYKSPEKPGLAYMLAGDIRVDQFGAITEQLYPPHVMLYAPGLTNADIGADPAAGDPSLPTVFAGGAGGEHLAYIIVPQAMGAEHMAH